MNKRNGLLTILIAAGVGYLVGLLYAPKKGDDMRHDLKKQAHKFKHDAEHEIHDKMNHIHDKFDDVSRKINKKIDKASDEQKPFLDSVKGEIAGLLDRIEKESSKDKKIFREVDLDNTEM